MKRAVAAVLVLLVLALGLGAWLYTDLLWYREVGYSTVMTTRIRTQVLLFVLGGGLLAAVVAANVVAAYRMRPRFRPDSLEQRNLDRYRTAVERSRLAAVLVPAAVLLVVAGSVFAARWQTWLAWRNAVPFGVEDPQFGRDVSYYAFTYPVQRMFLGLGFATLLLSVLAAGGVHYLYGGIRLQTRGEKVGAAARAHLSVLLGLVVLLKAAAYWVDQYGLSFSTRGRVTGASYADVNAELPALRILTVIAVICAALFFLNVRSRNWALPVTGTGLMLVSALLIGGLYPWAVQKARVEPNEVDLEERYIQRNIAATLRAYGLEGVEYRDYPPDTTEASARTVTADRETLPSARLLDPAHLGPTFEQRQRIRGYYGFGKELDVDRYTVEGKTQVYLVAARQLERAGLGSQQRNWINEHLQFTHGYGFVAAPVNQVTSDGEPAFAVRDIDSRGPIDITEPRIYYGELPLDYSVVRTTQQEIDRPSETGDATRNTYQGKGGVPIGGFTRRLLYALKFRDRNLLLSGAITDDSRLLYVRDPADRVAKVAPYLELDQDPYPAVVGGRIVWIVDGYTTTDGFPYAERVLFGRVTRDSRGVAQRQRQINYIRNSVKATVDAYDGTVTLYAWDETDPILKTWSRAFPGTVTPRAEMPADLVAHVRYPEDLFKVQRALIARYHIQDARTLFSGEDFWDVADDPNVEGSVDQPPFYQYLRFPGTPAPSFQLVTSLVARNRQNLAAVAAVGSDGADYGKIRVLRLPKQVAIPGPHQAGSTFLADPDASRDLTLLDQRGSKVRYGNLLTIPVGTSLVYVQPVYIQATSGSTIPQLRKVLVGFGDKVGYADTLAGALEDVFGRGTAPPTTPPTPPSTPPAGGSDELRNAIEEANKAFTDGQEALRRNDFAAYGEAQRRLQAALERARRAAGASPSPSPSPSG